MVSDPRKSSGSGDGKKQALPREFRLVRGRRRVDGALPRAVTAPHLRHGDDHEFTL